MNTAATPTAARSSFSSFLRGIVDEHWVDFAVGHVAPLFSVSRTKALVVAVTAETADAVRIDLAPNRNFRPHRAGQFVFVRPRIGGVVHERCYSLVSSPSDSTITLVVKRQPGGLVSNYLNDSLRVGDILELGTVAGEFCLPEETPRRLLLIAGGSGITPIYALAEAALESRPGTDVVLAYYARTKSDFILADKLEALRAEHPSLVIHYFVDRDEAGEGKRIEHARVGRFSEADLDAYASDLPSREIYVCGPPGLMNAVTRVCEERALGDRLHRESFGPSFDARAEGEAAEVVFEKSGLTATTTAPTLLVAAEEAGLRPAYGCRMGICHTCTCTKVSGVVRDRVTGQLDEAPNSRIRLCVSEPVSNVRIEL